MTPRVRFFLALAFFLFMVGAVLAGCAATRNAGIRRMAEAHAKFRGLADARAYCVDAGIERTCGEGRP